MRVRSRRELPVEAAFRLFAEEQFISVTLEYVRPTHKNQPLSGSHSNPRDTRGLR